MKRWNQWIVITLILMAFVVSSCKSNSGRVSSSASNTKAITSFTLEDANNANLATDVNATIDEAVGSITSTVPMNTSLTSLVPSFVTTGNSVTLAGVAQSSGVTANNFSTSLSYVVKAEDGSTKTYTVDVTEDSTGIFPLSASSKSINSFTFKASDNTGLASDISANISGSTMHAVVPYGYAGTILKPSFIVDAASMTVNSIAQISSESTHDFRNIIVYEVTAQDGSIAQYTLSTVNAPVHDTAQTTCYTGAGVVIGCTVAGSSDAQDGSYTSSTHSYTSSGGGTVVDNVSGLMWEDTNEGTSRNHGDAISHCSIQTTGGHSDWRLPTRGELAGLMDSEATTDRIDLGHFNIPINNYWSSTLTSEPSNDFWPVNFSSGKILSKNSTDNYLARCVRGNPPPQPLFSDNLDGTITDQLTGLTWQKCSDGQNYGVASDCSSGSSTLHPWAAALNHCETLNFAGQTDWRLPDRNELSSIVDVNQHPNAAVDPTAFPNTSLLKYWTSTTDSAAPVYAWEILFDYGDVADAPKGNSNSIRCVRLGL